MAPLWLQRFVPDLRTVTARFPLPLAGLLMLAGLLLAETHGLLPQGSSEVFDRLALGFGIFALGSLALALAIEEDGWLQRRTDGIAAPASALAAVVALLVGLAPSYDAHAMFLIPGLLALLAIAPYRAHGADAWSSYVSGPLMAAVMAGVMAVFAAVVLSLGASAALASIRYLFDLTLDDDWYGTIWILGMVLFAPAYWLSQLPAGNGASAGAYPLSTYPRSLAFIARYILTPLVLIYLVILYAYLGKILLQWELPKGNLAYMVAGFGVVGIATHLLTYPLRGEDRLIARLHRWFHPLLLLPIAMLWVAVAVRIAEYGLTEQRYGVALLALWMSVVALAMALRPATPPAFVPLLLGLLLLAASFGPWGAVHLSGSSQVARLERLLAREGILVDGRIRPATRDLDFEARKEISSITSYLAGSGKAWRIAHWFGPEDYVNRPHSRHWAGQIMKDMGVEYTEAFTREGQEFFSYYAPFLQGSAEVHRLAGGGYWIHVSEGQLNADLSLPLQDGDALRIAYDSASGQLRVALHGADGTARHRLSFPLADHLGSLRAHADESEMGRPRPVLAAHGDGIEGRLIVTSLTGSWVKSQFRPDTMGFDLLLTKK